MLNDGSLKGRDALWSDLGVRSGLHVGSLVGNESASTISGSVCPVLLVVGTVRLVVVEGVTLPATIAAEARLDAGYKLLLGELSDSLGALVLGDVVGRLEAGD